MHLAEYEWRRHSVRDTPESFVVRYNDYVRPLLVQMERCRLFAVPRQEGQWEPVGLYAEWERAGVRQDEWRASYIAEVQGELEIELRPDVLDDVLFWWWMLPGNAPFQTLLLTAMGRFDAPGYFSRVEDPVFIRGAYGAIVTQLHGYAKQETKANDRIAFWPQRRLVLSVIASPANVARLFEVAVSHGRFNF